MERINKPNASFTQQANSGALSKKKIHASLTAQILILYVSLVVLAAATISVIFMVTIDRYSKGVIAVDVLLNKPAEIVLAQEITPEEYLTRGKLARLTISKSPMIKTTCYTRWEKLLLKGINLLRSKVKQL